MMPNYEIKNLKVAYFKNPDGYNIMDTGFRSGNYICQFMYVHDGKLEDIFKNTYFSSLYSDGEMPEFYYNPSNNIHFGYFSDEEKRSGLISDKRLLELYCLYNSLFLKYDSKDGVKRLDDKNIKGLVYYRKKEK